MTNAYTSRIVSVIRNKGRQASAVNDTTLRDSVRIQLADLAEARKQPQTPSSLLSIAAAVCRAAARTIIFEDEVPIALEMGAAGLFPVSTNITQTNCGSWVTSYAASEERRAALERISLDAARDRRRADAITAEEHRRDFEENGLARAWETYCREGWSFMTAGYPAAVYELIGPEAIRDIVPADRRRQARAEALHAVRHSYPSYIKSPDAEVEATEVFKIHAKGELVHAYFDTLREKGLTPENAIAL